MEDIILYCKSYRGDIDRFKNLLQSIIKYNKDNIPFYVCIPKQDNDIFKNIIIDNAVNIIFDEDVSNVKEQSHFTQQLFKMEFYKLNISKYFFLIDSDMYFIKDFTKSDFFCNNIPYMTMHECKDFLEYSHIMYGDNRANDWFIGERKPIMELFNRKGKFYDYSGSANLYISEIFKKLYEEYCKPNNLTFLDLLRYCSSENTWYGEYVLATNTEFYACNPMFKTFHTKWQYNHHKSLGITEDMISKNYLGITMQSNWNSPLKY